MLEAFVKLKLWWFLDVRNICKVKTLVVVPRC